MRLFDHGIEPADVAQGQLGDCWLISAFACLTEFPGAIESLFLNHEYASSGQYQIRIYDALMGGGAGGFKTITIDDTIPCRKAGGRPVFAQPNGNELWVVLLEKAFAKFVGSFAELEGGMTCWALQAMTGDISYRFTHENLTDSVPSPVTGVEEAHEWTKLDLRSEPSPDNPRKCSFRTTPSFKPLSDDEFYDHLKRLHASGCVLAASSKGTDHTLTQGRGGAGKGIVPGHAYTIVNVYESFGWRLLKLRNPWGTFEWSGAWSDDSIEWKTHPQVLASVKLLVSGNSRLEKGSFWMSYSDFKKHFGSVDVCERSLGLGELRLHVREEFGGACGAAVGCSAGCCCFWCGCQGLRKMVFTRDSSRSASEAAKASNKVSPSPHAPGGGGGGSGGAEAGQEKKRHPVGNSGLVLLSGVSPSGRGLVYEVEWPPPPLLEEEADNGGGSGGGSGGGGTEPKTALLSLDFSGSTNLAVAALGPGASKASEGEGGELKVRLAVTRPIAPSAAVCTLEPVNAEGGYGMKASFALKRSASAPSAAAKKALNVTDL